MSNANRINVYLDMADGPLKEAFRLVLPDSEQMAYVASADEADTVLSQRMYEEVGLAGILKALAEAAEKKAAASAPSGDLRCWRCGASVSRLSDYCYRCNVPL